MFSNLSTHEKRTLTFCMTASGLILLYFLAFEPMTKNWRLVRKDLQTARAEIRQLGADETGQGLLKQQLLIQKIPVVEIPKKSGIQGPLFMEQFTEQLKKAGVKSKSLELMQSRFALKNSLPQYEVWTLEAKGRSQYSQILTLLDSLQENPHYAGIRKMTLKVDQKKRSEMDWELTIFTFASR